MSMALRARRVAETFYGDDWVHNRDENGNPLATPAIIDLLGEEMSPENHD